jgi:hypothetical protein
VALSKAVCLLVAPVFTVAPTNGRDRLALGLVGFDARVAFVATTGISMRSKSQVP